MERRKVQKIGPSSLGISLPKKWTKESGIKQGDVINIVQEKDGALKIISTIEEEAVSQEYTIHCDQLTQLSQLGRLIVAAYMMGINTIRIVAAERIPIDVLETVGYFVQTLVGANITEQTENKVIISLFIDSSKLDVLSLLQKQANIVTTMLNEAIDALLELNPSLAKVCINREKSVDSLEFLITRMVFYFQRMSTNEITHEVGLNPISVRMISKNLERIADCTEYLAKVVLNLDDVQSIVQTDIPCMKNLEKLSHSLKSLYTKAIDAVFSMNLDIANEANDLRRNIDAELWKSMFDLQGIRIPYFRAISIMFSMIAENSANIAIETFNMAISHTKED